MKALQKMNTLALAIPLIIAITYPVFKEGAIIFALLSTMLTGLIQFSIGVKMLVDNPKDRYIQIYISAVILFFVLWLFNGLIGYNNFMSYVLVPVPLILAIYLSILIYKKQ
jgi:hypothetical protein